MNERGRRTASEIRASVGAGIDEGCLYPVERFRELMNLTRSAFRSMKRAGLRTIKFGKRVFVSGRDAVEFLRAWGEKDDVVHHEAG